MENSNKIIFEEIRTEYVLKAATYTTQLYIYSDGKLKPTASGVFVTDQENYYLFTAAHVFDNKNNVFSTHVPLSNNFTLIEGEFDYTPNTISDYNKQIDMAIIKLKSNCFEKLLKQYDFYNLLHCDYDYLLNPDDLLMPVGFPSSQTKLKRKLQNHHFERRHISILSSLNKVFLTKQEEEKKEMIELNYDRKTFRKNGEGIDSETSPHPLGMSGCGIWLITPKSFENYPSIKPWLIGILTEFHESDKLIKGTRINLFTEFLRHSFNSKIPASKIKKIDFK